MTVTAPLSTPEKKHLLQLAREALRAAVCNQAPPPVEAAQLTPALTRPGASFITLTEHGELRGCIGGLRAELPLYQDVREHAAQAALRDYRFPPVSPEELPDLDIEVSVLTQPQRLEYEKPEDLLRDLRPEVDGVILMQGLRRATFLPQVWERVPDAEMFLSMLCEKMGAHPDAWRKTKLEVQTYQVEKFTESELGTQK